jgi:hypothetical protein
MRIHKHSPTSDLERANNMISAQEVEMYLDDGLRFKGKEIQITPDSTILCELDSGQRRAFSNTQVDHIKFKKRGRGALEGMGIGFLVGFSTGMVLGASTNDGSNFLGLSQTETAMLVGAYVGVPGGLIGVPTGLLIGSRYKILIE